MVSRAEYLDDPEEAQRLLLENMQAGIWTAMPGIVTGVDLVANTVTVQIAIRGSQTGADGIPQATTLPLLTDVPICWPNGGNGVLTFPIEEGDECDVIFQSRGMDFWWQSGGVQRPAEMRMHDLSDGTAHFGLRSQPRRIENVSPDTTQLRTIDGTTYVELADGGEINIVAPTKVTITTPLVEMSGNLLVQGGIASNGVGGTNITAAGNIITPQDVIAGVISLKTHRTTLVQPGIGTSGVPTP